MQNILSRYNEMKKSAVEGKLEKSQIAEKNFLIAENLNNTLVCNQYVKKSHENFKNT